MTHGLVDTGAQHGVIGLPQHEGIVAFLKTHGLQPRILPLTQGGATGVGGDSQFILTAEYPMAIQGVCGTVKLNVLKQPIPFLLPVSFSKNLGMVLDMPEERITWKYIDRQQDYISMPSGHIAVECFEFPPGGWKNPHESAHKPLGDLYDETACVPRSAFEITD